MSLTISAVRSWDLETVGSHVRLLRDDDEGFDSSATAVRLAAPGHLDGLEGDTVSASTRRCYDIQRSLVVLARMSERLASTLDIFYHAASVYRPKLLDEVERAVTEGFAVADHGAVRPPSLIGEPTDPAVMAAHTQNTQKATAYGDEFGRLLTALEACDLEAANALNAMSMTESYVHYPYSPSSAKVDPRTALAGGAISLNTGIVSLSAENLGAASAVTRALPGFGTSLSLAIGFATSPDGEPLAETLAAEGAGALVTATSAWLMNIGTTALFGAGTGTVVPGVGTAAGLLGGVAFSIFGAPHLSAAARDHFNEQRADGKVAFQW